MLNELVTAFSVMAALVSVFWVISLYLKNAAVVDSAWSLLFLAASVVWLNSAGAITWIQWLVLSLALIWALRLSLYLTIRNYGKPEDRRYQDIRRRYQPWFGIKSLFIIFLFQAVLALIIALPLWQVFVTPFQPGWLSAIAVLLWVTGFGFETIADWQLYRFLRRNPGSNAVFNRGLWRYSRHPNYFGEFLVWWGFYLFAVDANAAWTVISPLLMTYLLLRFSGVTLLEKDIGARRPAYQQYCESTNAFFPGPPKKTAHKHISEGA